MRKRMIVKALVGALALTTASCGSRETTPQQPIHYDVQLYADQVFPGLMAKGRVKITYQGQAGEYAAVRLGNGTYQFTPDDPSRHTLCTDGQSHLPDPIPLGSTHFTTLVTC